MSSMSHQDMSYFQFLNRFQFSSGLCSCVSWSLVSDYLPFPNVLQLPATAPSLLHTWQEIHTLLLCNSNPVLKSSKMTLNSDSSIHFYFRTIRTIGLVKQELFNEKIIESNRSLPVSDVGLMHRLQWEQTGGSNASFQINQAYIFGCKLKDTVLKLNSLFITKCCRLIFLLQCELIKSIMSTSAYSGNMLD